MRLLIALIILGLVIALIRFLTSRGKVDDVKRIDNQRDDDDDPSGQ